MDNEPIGPDSPSLALRRRLFGVGLAGVSALILILVYVVIPGGWRFPAVVLALPAVAIAAGLFQAVTGLTLFEVNSQLPLMPAGRKAGVIAALLLILLAVIGAFLWLLLRAGGLA